MSGIGYVLLYRGSGPVAKLIQWQTRSVYSHAALLLPDGVTVIESQYPKGVRERAVTDADRTSADCFVVSGMNDDHWDRALSFARDELGAGYDYRSIFRFLTRRDSGSDTLWFCAEFVFAVLQFVGCSLLLRIHAWAAAPGHLSWSPKLTLVNWPAVAPAKAGYGLPAKEGAR